MFWLPTRADRCQIHAATAQAFFPDLADVPGKPWEEHGVGGLFYGAGHSLPGTLPPITGFEVLTACGSMVLHFRSEPIKATMEVTMLDRLVEIFCEVDDFCKAFQDAFESHLIGNGPGPRGPAPGLADA